MDCEHSMKPDNIPELSGVDGVSSAEGYSSGAEGTSLGTHGARRLLCREFRWVHREGVEEFGVSVHTARPAHPVGAASPVRPVSSGVNPACCVADLAAHRRVLVCLRRGHVGANPVTSLDRLVVDLSSRSRRA
jgi:hypothetical protein